jgi:hypothetical protein
MIRVVFRDTGAGYDSSTPVDALFDLFYSKWPNRNDGQKDLDSPQGFGLFAVRRLLKRYGVKTAIKREGDETLAILEIPL